MTLSDATLKDIQHHFLTQARYCEELDSPFMVRLCRLFAKHLEEDHTFTAHLRKIPLPENFWGMAMPLRIAGALHALVLTRQCSQLAKVYPPHHEHVNDSELWNALEHAIHDHEQFVLHFLDFAPQTNEVRRSGILLPGFLKIVHETGLPLLLSELGASAGINLCWDSFGYQLNGQPWGDPESPVQLAPQWHGNPPPQTIPIAVTTRAACDLHPVSFKDPEQRLRLLSYIWADQFDRFDRTSSALKILEDKAYKVTPADISRWLPMRLWQPVPGTVHVIYHSIAWTYQDPVEQEKNQKVIEAAGARASRQAPLAWLRLEADGEDPGAALTLTLWPGGEERLLARADYHGRWIDWKA